MTDQERYIKRETKMQNFRWATPGLLFVLTIAIGFIGWIGNDCLTQIRYSIIDLKTDGTSHYDRLWAAIGSSKSRIDCVQNQLSKCCNDSMYCV